LNLTVPVSPFHHRRAGIAISRFVGEL
jgi:hypothetical protein